MYALSQVDRSIESDVRLIVDNDEAVFENFREECARSVCDDDASTNDVPNVYRQAHRDRSGEWYTFCICAGLRVADVERERSADIGEDGSDFMRLLVAQILDLGNQSLWAEIAEAYMPEPDDVDTWFD